MDLEIIPLFPLNQYESVDKYMDTQIEDTKREKFREILKDLSRSQETLKSEKSRLKVFTQLEDLYYIDKNTRFRHFYSDIFSTLTQIKLDGNCNIDILGQNLSIIRAQYKPLRRDETDHIIDVSNEIRKLYDHVSLDIARLAYSDNQDWQILQDGKLSNIKSRILDLESEYQKQIKTTNAHLANTQKKIENIQKEYIAILGIFSAVVLAFTAGIAFSTSVFENIHKASIYRLILICCIVGLVLLDLIFILFRYTDKIARDKEYGIKQYIPIIIANVVIFLLIVSTIICWRFGVVEKRDQMLNNQTTICIIKEGRSSESLM